MQWRKIFFRVLQSDSMMFSWSGYNWGIFVLVGHLSTAPNLPGSFEHGYVVVASRWKHLSGSCCEHEQSDCKVKLGLNVREDRVRVRARTLSYEPPRHVGPFHLVSLDGRTSSRTLRMYEEGSHFSTVMVVTAKTPPPTLAGLESARSMSNAR